jgi:undecaprenyl-diphosphatase
VTAEPPASLLDRLGAVDARLSARLVPAGEDGGERAWIRALRRFSQAGSYGIGWVVAFAVVAVSTDGFAAGSVAALAVVAMLGVNTVIKNIIRRPRPTVRAIDHAPTSWSMPSAHTSMAMVGAATMSVLLPALAPLLWLTAAALGLSRVVLGMHYLGDVLAGAALGMLVGLLVAAPLVAAAA